MRLLLQRQGAVLHWVLMLVRNGVRNVGGLEVVLWLERRTTRRDLAALGVRLLNLEVL